MRNLNTVFLSGCNQQCKVSLFYKHLPTHYFLIIIILSFVKLYLMVVLTCISLQVMFSDVEHLLMYLLAICMYSLEKMSIQIFYSFQIRSLLFLLFNCMSSLYILDTRPFSDIWFAKIFSYFIHKLPFNFTDHFFAVQNLFILFSYSAPDILISLLNLRKSTLLFQSLIREVFWPTPKIALCDCTALASNFIFHYTFITVVVQSLSRVQLFVAPWSAAHQASLFFIIAQCLPKCLLSQWC